MDTGTQVVLCGVPDALLYRLPQLCSSNRSVWADGARTVGYRVWAITWVARASVCHESGRPGGPSPGGHWTLWKVAGQAQILRRLTKLTHIALFSTILQAKRILIVGSVGFLTGWQMLVVSFLVPEVLANFVTGPASCF